MCVVFCRLFSPLYVRRRHARGVCASKREQVPWNFHNFYFSCLSGFQLTVTKVQTRGLFKLKAFEGVHMFRCVGPTVNWSVHADTCVNIFSLYGYTTCVRKHNDIFSICIFANCSLANFWIFTQYMNYAMGMKGLMHCGRDDVSSRYANCQHAIYAFMLYFCQMFTHKMYTQKNHNARGTSKYIRQYTMNIFCCSLRALGIVFRVFTRAPHETHRNRRYSSFSRGI